MIYICFLPFFAFYVHFVNGVLWKPKFSFNTYIPIWFLFPFKIGFHHVSQSGLELVVLSDPPTLTFHGRQSRQAPPHLIQYQFLKGQFFVPLNSAGSLINQLPYMWGCIFGLSLLFHWSVCLQHYANTTLPWLPLSLEKFWN